MTNEFGEFEKLRQRRPQAATIRVSTKVTRKSKVTVGFNDYLPWFVARNLGRPPPLPTGWHQFDHEKQNQNRNLKRNRNHEIKEDKQEAETQLKHEMEDGKQEAKVESEPCHRGGTKPFSWDTEKRRRRETSAATRAGTRRNQEITMEQNFFPATRKKREEGRQAPEPEPEPRETSKSWWNKGHASCHIIFSLLHWFVCETFSG